ncbi:Histone-lysine N-methyltransferase setd7 [Serendipita sp. 400]|nr:Histone-lysine N-methyltransferase setd7 [Serendipita sp. 400]
MEKIPRDSIIAPYTGEYYREDTASNRELVAKYLQRNYNYELNKQLHIDGTRSGNETRFINDPRNPSKANCRPDCMSPHRVCYYGLLNPPLVVWVGGDLHLTIRTSKDIFPGDEILLSYGENYWSTDLERRSLNDSKRRRSFGAGDKIRRKKSQEGKHMK